MNHTANAHLGGPRGSQGFSVLEMLKLEETPGRSMGKWLVCKKTGVAERPCSAGHLRESLEPAESLCPSHGNGKTRQGWAEGKE